MQLFISSGDLAADRRFEFANDLRKRGDLAGAADLYAQAVEVAPDFASAWFALGEVRLRLGDSEGAATAFRRAAVADPQDRHGAALHLARLSGTPAPMPAGYVRTLFDQYAQHYDLSLLDGLDYRGPRLLRDAVVAVCAGEQRRPAFAYALDLGCGTGLAVTAFGPHVASLTGIDLSPAMIEAARRRGGYDRLEVGDFFEVLAGLDEAAFDLVLAADSLPYCSDLAPLARAVARVLAPAALFAFTVETHDGTGVLMRDTLRYAHGADHVRSALVQAGFACLSLEQAASRREKSVPVPGLVVVAFKPGLDRAADAR